MDQREKLRKVIGKINILIETVEWRDAGLRSNEIDIASQHLREALKEFGLILWPKVERK